MTALGNTALYPQAVPFRQLRGRSQGGASSQLPGLRATPRERRHPTVRSLTLHVPLGGRFTRLPF
jgi:hypothetical protein